MPALSPKLQSVSLSDQPFLVTKHFEAPNNPQMTLNTTRSKVHYNCVANIPESQLSLLFSLRPAMGCKVVDNGKNLKCTEWPQINIEHLTVKVPLCYALSTYHRGTNVGPFFSTASRFQDTRLSKIRNALNDLRLTFKITKVPCIG